MSSIPSPLPPPCFSIFLEQHAQYRQLKNNKQKVYRVGSSQLFLQALVHSKFLWVQPFKKYLRQTRSSQFLYEIGHYGKMSISISSSLFFDFFVLLCFFCIFFLCISLYFFVFLFFLSLYFFVFFCFSVFLQALVRSKFLWVQPFKKYLRQTRSRQCLYEIGHYGKISISIFQEIFCQYSQNFCFGCVSNR